MRTMLRTAVTYTLLRAGTMPGWDDLEGHRRNGVGWLVPSVFPPKSTGQWTYRPPPSYLSPLPPPCDRSRALAQAAG